jgi:hypothetical protein
MNNAEQNQTQAEQKREAAESPAKGPAEDTSAIQSPDIHKAANQPTRDKGNRPSEQSAPDDTLSEDDLPRDHAPTSDFDEVKPRSVDHYNTGATDDTVDTDGKNREAQLDPSPMRDNVIANNPTLDNNVPVPAFGLGGFDSRQGGNEPPIATRPGSHVVSKGTVTGIESPDPRAHGFPAQAAVPGRTEDGENNWTHQQPNNVRVAHVIRIEADGEEPQS